MVRNEVFHNDINSEKLVRLIKDGHLIVFVGSGLSSINELYPSWWKLVNKLCNACNVQSEAEINDQTSPKDLQKLAGQARNSDENAYAQTLEQEFAKTVTDMPRSYQLLIRAPFKSFVTINFDPLLAIESHQFFKDKNFLIHAFPQFDYKALNQGGIFYLHGYIPQDGPVDMSKIVLTEDDFNTAYNNEKGNLCLIWQILLRYHPILFIGCRLGEPELDIIFSISNSARSALSQHDDIKPKPRFILLEKEAYKYSEISPDEQLRRNKEKEEEENKKYREMDIVVVRYDSKDKAHSGLIKILEEWTQIGKPIIYKEEVLDYI